MAFGGGNRAATVNALWVVSAQHRWSLDVDPLRPEIASRTLAGREDLKALHREAGQCVHFNEAFCSCTASASGLISSSTNPPAIK